MPNSSSMTTTRLAIAKESQRSIEVMRAEAMSVSESSGNTVAKQATRRARISVIVQDLHLVKKLRTFFPKRLPGQPSQLSAGHVLKLAEKLLDGLIAFRWLEIQNELFRWEPL